jgi:heme-degrading monooxygenase HmoA
MFARVSRFAGLPPERIEATLKQFQEEHLPAIKQLDGYQGVQVLVDPQGGQAIAITYWETRDHLIASDKLATAARAAAVSELDPAREPLVDRFEVLLDEQA